MANEPILDSFVTVLKYLLNPGQPPDQGLPTNMPADPMAGQPPVSPQPVQDDLAPILSLMQGGQPTGQFDAQGRPSPQMSPQMSQPMAQPMTPPNKEGRIGSMAMAQQSGGNQMKDNLFGTLQKLGIM